MTREVIRDLFSVLMFIFLLAGCIHNVYHFQQIDNHNAYSRQRYNPYDRTTTSSIDYDEIEEIPSTDELDEVTVTPSNNEENSVREEYYGY